VNLFESHEVKNIIENAKRHPSIKPVIFGFIITPFEMGRAWQHPPQYVNSQLLLLLIFDTIFSEWQSKIRQLYPEIMEVFAT